MSDWIGNLLNIPVLRCYDNDGVKEQMHAASVLISVIRTHGSCPRDAGTRMLVTADSCHGTIGGGHLEYQAISIAHQVLLLAPCKLRVERFPLGARVGQCCGGVVYLSFEYIASVRPRWVAALAALRNVGKPAIMVTWSQAKHCDASRLIVSEDACLGALADDTQQQKALARALDLLNSSAQACIVQEGALLYEKVGSSALQFAVFGAGHVGCALVSVLCGLPCQIHWFDSREAQFPDHLADNVCAAVVDHPEHEVDDLPSGAHVVVMTHSHALDQAICERMLRRDDLAWYALIGSVTKRRQFEKRLLARGLSRGSLAKLTCPIGVDGITGKHPTEIAIAVAAQLLRAAQSSQHDTVCSKVFA